MEERGGERERERGDGQSHSSHGAIALPRPFPRSRCLRRLPFRLRALLAFVCPRPLAVGLDPPLYLPPLPLTTHARLSSPKSFTLSTFFFSAVVSDLSCTTLESRSSQLVTPLIFLALFWSCDPACFFSVARDRISIFEVAIDWCGICFFCICLRFCDELRLYRQIWSEL